MRSIRKLITVCLGVVVAIVVGATPAHAATSWTLYGTEGDVVGVHASGIVEYHSNGRLYLYGTIEDTRSDGRGACLHIAAYYANTNTPRQELVCNNNGHGTKVNIGPEPGGSFDFASNVREIVGREGVRLSDGTIAYREGDWMATIWKK